MKCPYCQGEVMFLTSKQFYGVDYGTNVYSCKPCDAYVGTHGNTKQPLGTLANKELRKYRSLAHKAFDPLWKTKGMTRTAAYRWMSEQMSIPPQEAHIGMFNINQCKQIIELLSVVK
jgi:hypothetical protein